MFDLNFRAHRLQTFDMLINRARTNGTTAGQRHPRGTCARQHRPQHKDCGTHGFNHLVRRYKMRKMRGSQFRFIVGCRDTDTHLPEKT